MQSEHVQLITRLLEKTTRDEVVWRPANQFSMIETSEDTSEDYAVSTSNITLNLLRARAGGAGLTRAIILNILNDSGDIISHISVTEGDAQYSAMEELLTKVKTYVLGEDRALKMLLRDLQTEGKVIGRDDDDPF